MRLVHFYDILCSGIFGNKDAHWGCDSSDSDITVIVIRCDSSLLALLCALSTVKRMLVYLDNFSTFFDVP